nr:DapH/DapD/GlmU-related protein [uncultured Rhodoferax sp.]
MTSKFAVWYINLYVKFRLIYLKSKLKTQSKIGQDVKFYGFPILQLARSSTIHIGARSIFRSTSRWNVLGINHPCIISTLSPNGSIFIGDDVGISGASICAFKSIHIGSKTLLGVNVKIIDTDFHPVSPVNRIYAKAVDAGAAEVYIGNNVFIGANSLILKGVTIGDNTVIGAGSVVVRDLPADVIAAGNPCKVIRKLNA